MTAQPRASRLTWCVLLTAALGTLATNASANVNRGDGEETELGASPPPATQRASLSLDEVLRSASERHPVGRAAAENRRAFEAAAEGASGAWDPLLRVEGKSAELGYYRYRELDAQLTQNTPLWGTSLFAGYRVGTGDFPVYRVENETLSAGELRAGVNVPLWQDGPIDSRRATIEKTRALADAASCEEFGTRLSIQRRAAAAYWAWVEAGRVVNIERELLDVAERRQAAIATQAELGSLAPVLVLDNQRLVLERKLKLNTAEQSFRQASIALSLFYRDDSGTPIVVDDERLPHDLVRPQEPMRQLDAATTEAVNRRPEVCSLRRRLAAAGVDVRLADNQVAPALDAKAYVARDLGEGPEQLQQTELAVGVSFEMPLGLRKARADLDMSRAKSRQLHAELQNVRDTITAEVGAALVQLERSFEQWRLAHEQLSAARRLSEAEREKFLQGSSDLVVVNLRELAVAEAAKQEVAAAADFQRARVDYETALGRPLR